VISPTAVGFGIGDPAGNVTVQLLYNTPLGPFPLASPLPEPDSLRGFFTSEMSPPPSFPCNVPDSPPCPIGTSGGQTFARGEFSFVSAAVAEPPTWLLLGFGLIIVGFQWRLS